LVWQVLLKDHVLQSKIGKQCSLERDIGYKCDSPFLVNLCGTFKDATYLYMFMEPVLGGEVFTYVERNRIKGQGITEEEARFYAG
jgi:serine/threonine protein kinase